MPSAERYSIGCILFRKDLWPTINDGGTDDEHMFHQYCRKNDARIVCTRSVPFVHFAYFSQRDENRDIVPRARDLYEKRLSLPWPIALRASRELEIEARLRWIEGSGLAAGAPTGLQAHHSFSNLSPEDFATQAAKGLIKKIMRKLKLRK